MDLLCNKELKEEQSPNKQSMNKLQEPERLSRPPGMLPCPTFEVGFGRLLLVNLPPQILVLPFVEQTRHL